RYPARKELRDLNVTARAVVWSRELLAARGCAARMADQRGPCLVAGGRRVSRIEATHASPRRTPRAWTARGWACWISMATMAMPSRSPKGRAHDARVCFASTWMCCRKSPEPARGPVGQDARRAPDRGVLYLGNYSLATQSEVTRAGRTPVRNAFD